jgi:hypothetical protein
MIKLNIKQCSPDDVSLLHLVCGNLPPQLFPISCTRMRLNRHWVRRSSDVSTTAYCQTGLGSIPPIGLESNYNVIAQMQKKLQIRHVENRRVTM